MSPGHLAGTGADLVFLLHPDDNVLVARIDLPAGTPIVSHGLTARDAIPAGHKLARRTLRHGEPIVKCRATIGFAVGDVADGSLLSGDRIEFREFERVNDIGTEYRPIEPVSEVRRRSFEGFRRADGRVGTRNYLAVVSTVNCSATVAHAIADAFTTQKLADFPHVGGVAAFTHTSGCGMAMTGEPMQILRRTLGGYLRHPNVAGALVVGLGCERNQIATLLEDQSLSPGPMLHTLVMQETGGTRRSIEEGIARIQTMLPMANRARRECVPAAHLTVGLQCGGSDAFSSLSANPALGVAVDLLGAQGGTAILSETPEIYGVEYLLTRRAASQAIGERLLERLRWWKDDYARGSDTQINGRLNPGNQKGGLVNIFEKSLGAVMKGGSGPLNGVYLYAEQVHAHGLVFMDTPGLDHVSATGQIAGGANLVAFTTGRGSMYGASAVPTLKLASNTPMYCQLTDDMDVNCGEVLDGTVSLQDMGQRIFEQMLQTASGEPTRSEALGVGRHEFAPWVLGVTG